jgi:hypothetical protein
LEAVEDGGAAYLGALGWKKDRMDDCRCAAVGRDMVIMEGSPFATRGGCSWGWFVWSVHKELNSSKLCRIEAKRLFNGSS